MPLHPVSFSWFLGLGSPVSVLKGKQLFLSTYLLKQCQARQFQQERLRLASCVNPCFWAFQNCQASIALVGHTSSFRSSPGLLDPLSNNQSSLTNPNRGKCYPTCWLPDTGPEYPEGHERSLFLYCQTQS